jgi:hypothetical protein
MNYVRDLSEIEVLEPVARDFSVFLSEPSNSDIASEFPNTVDAYTGRVDKVTQNLTDVKDACNLGFRHQFIVFSGEHAVGMSVVRIVDEVPAGVDGEFPNLSGFICNPYRSQGLGRLSLLTRLAVVDAYFGGEAWTKVKKINNHSNAMVIHAGFRLIGEDSAHNIYTYASRK